MPNNWMRFGRSEDPDEHQGEFKPEEFKTQLAGEFETKFKTFQEDQEKKMSPLLEMAAQFAEQRRAAEDAKTREQNKNQREDEEITDDSDLWITNPAEASRRQNLTLSRQTQATAALLMRREVLDGMEYYSDPKIKAKVDELIEQQPLAQRSNSSLLRNAYYTVVGQHTAEIREGKIKERTSNTNFNGNGTGGRSGDGKDAVRVFTDEEKYMMKQFNMNEKDVEKSEQELNYV